MGKALKILIFTSILGALLTAIGILLFGIYKFSTIFIGAFFFIFNLIGYHTAIMSLFLFSLLVLVILSIYKFVSNFIS